MEHNREQIIKALECISGGDLFCDTNCPYHSYHCEIALSRDALALIKELTEENERVRAIPEQLHKEMSERMVEERKIERKLAVRQMQERLTTFFANDDMLKYNEVDADYINECIEQIAKKIEGGEG